MGKIVRFPRQQKEPGVSPEVAFMVMAMNREYCDRLDYRPKGGEPCGNQITGASCDVIPPRHLALVR